MNKGDEVVCIKTKGTKLDNRIVYVVSNTSLDGKFITVYGYTSMYKSSIFKPLKEYRKDILLSLIYDIKRKKTY